MRINKKQEVALWILGLLWAGGLFFIALDWGTPSDTTFWADVAPIIIAQWISRIIIAVALLIPTLLIIFSLRDRKPD